MMKIGFNPDAVGKFALHLFAVCSGLASAGVLISLFLMLLCWFPLNYRSLGKLPRDPQLLIILILILYLPVCTLIAVGRYPDQFANHWHTLEKWLILCAPPLLAYWMRRGKVSSLLFLAVCGISLWLDMLWLTLTEWEMLRASIDTNGYNFGRPKIATGLYIGTSILGLMVFMPRLHRYLGADRPTLFYVLWALVLGLLILAILVADSRGVWLSTGLVLLAAALATVIRHRKTVRWSMIRKSGLPVGLAVAIFAGLLAWNHQHVLDRAGKEQNVIQLMLAGQWDNLPYTSIGLRIHVYRAGWEKWQEHPLFGWGPGESRWLVRSLEDENLHILGHFHNIYLELLLRLGLTGFLLFMGFVVSLLLDIAIQFRKGRLPGDVTVFLSGAFFMYLIWGLTDSRWTHLDWMFYWIILTSVSLEQIWRARQARKTAASPAAVPEQTPD